MQSLENANEADVREDIASPFLALLGYKRGTENDILRELSLSYNFNFLGRKKDKDPPLRGKADYVLSVAGAGRWVLETKPPHETITIDSINQAITYARHPEVSGTYVAILNGKRFVLFSNTQLPTSPPLVDIEVISPEHLAEKLHGTLSPQAIRRNCTPKTVDLGTPLASGLRSHAEILGGKVQYQNYKWTSNVDMPDPARQILDETCRRLGTYQSTITNGRVWRDESSRIRAKLCWSSPNQTLEQFAIDKRLMEVEYVSLDNTISTDPNKPTVFDVIGDVHIYKGERLFDIVKWETTYANLNASMNYRGQAFGYIKDGIFIGTFEAEYEMQFPNIPGRFINHYANGKFEVIFDTR